MNQSTARTSRLRSTQWIFGALVLAVLSVAVLLAARPTSAEPTGPTSEDKHITRAITILMNHEHLTRHPLDNEISERWLDNYLKMLDPRKAFFTQQDVDGWNQYRDQLDDMAVQRRHVVCLSRVRPVSRPHRPARASCKRAGLPAARLHEGRGHGHRSGHDRLHQVRCRDARSLAEARQVRAVGHGGRERPQRQGSAGQDR